MKYLLFAAMLLTVITAGAETYGFNSIHYAENDFAQSVGGQLFMDVADPSEGSKGAEGVWRVCSS